MIYKYALDRIPKQQAQELFKYYTMFEKRFGDRRGIEDVIVSKRRFQYEEEVKVFPVCCSRIRELILITFLQNHFLWFLSAPFVLILITDVPVRRTHTTMTPGLITSGWWRTTPTPTR